MDRAVSLEARPIDLAVEPCFEVGCAKIDPRGRDITVRGTVERIQPQTLKVLIALHDRVGKVVTRDELIDRCWDGRIVGEDVINRCISMLRRCAAGFRIETIPRAGYRLIEEPPRRGTAHSMWAVMAGVALLLTIVCGWIFERGTLSSRSGPPTIGLMPLAEDSRDPEVHELAVATRSSVSDSLTEGGYPVTLLNTRAGKRGPDLLISGDVRRLASSVQAIVQVEEMRHGVIVFSHRYETDATSKRALPDQIGASVASNLAWAATLMKLDRGYPSNPAVAAAMLEAARLNVEGDDSVRAYEIVRRVAPTAPNSAVAQFSLAAETGLVLDDLPREQRSTAVQIARQALDRVLVLAPHSGEAYAAWCAIHGAALIVECEDHLRKGIAVDPDASWVWGPLGALLDSVGRIDEALRAEELGRASEPYMPATLARLIRIEEEDGDDAEAEQLFQQSMRWWPGNRGIIWNRLVGIELRGDYAALERFEKQVGRDALPLDLEPSANLIGAVRAHDNAQALRACSGNHLRWTTQFLCMTALADLGETERSIAIGFNLFPPVHPRSAAEAERIWLDQPGGFSLAALSSPAATSLRRDSRFMTLADGSGLLDYWRTGRLPDFCTKAREKVCARIMSVQ